MSNDHLRIEVSRCRHNRQVNGHQREGGRIDSEYIAEQFELRWPD